MDLVKVSAKTVEDALTEASIQLGTSSDNIEYTVLDEGSKGFFGIGGRKAVIEARKKVTDEDLMKEIFDDKPEKQKKEPKKEYKKEYKHEKKENREPVKENDRNSGKEAGKESRREPKKDPKKDPRKDARKEQKKEVRKDYKNESPAENRNNSRNSTRNEVRQEVKQESKPEPKRDAKREAKKDFVKGSAGYGPVRERSVDSLKDTAREEFGKFAETETGEAESRISRTPADPEEAKRRAVDFIKEVLHAMDLEVEVRAEFEDGNLCVDIEGEDMGIMIGKRGQTLDSLQYLTSLVVNKGNASYVRVKLDTEDYRNRRKATLENLAKNIAMKVKKTKRPVFLEPMNPYERRIIHSALQNDPYVTTHSEGDEPYRKVVVTLRKDRDKGHGGYLRYNNRRSRFEPDLTDVKSDVSESAETAETSDLSEE